MHNVSPRGNDYGTNQNRVSKHNSDFEDDDDDEDDEDDEICVVDDNVTPPIVFERESFPRSVHRQESPAEHTRSIKNLKEPEQGIDFFLIF